MAKSKYYSQKGQDRLVHSIFFNKKEDGFFLDIGAYDGISFSNTYFFEINLNWKGICIEPIPEVFKRLVKNRNCIHINACIDNKNGALKFTRVKGYSEMLSGISERLGQKHLERIEKSLKQFGGEMEELEVKAITVKNIIDEYNVDRVDLLKVDTEGNEWPIIQSFPFEKLKPKVILVENNNDNEIIKDFLIQKGYTFCINFGDDVYYSGKLPISSTFKLLLFKINYFLKSRFKILFKS